MCDPAKLSVFTACASQSPRLTLQKESDTRSFSDYVDRLNERGVIKVWRNPLAVLADLLLICSSTSAFTCFGSGRCLPIDIPANGNSYPRLLGCRNPVDHAALYMSAKSAKVMESSSLEHERIRRACMTWVSDFVVKHNLCPWAQGALSHLKFSIIDKSSRSHQISNEELDHPYAELMALASELVEAQEKPHGDSRIKTVLIALPDYHKFEDFISMSEKVESLLDSTDLDEHISLAKFHPDFRLRDENGELLYSSTVPSDYRSRAPYPLLHYLLNSDIDAADDEYSAHGGDLVNLCMANALKMEKMSKQLGGDEGMRRMLAAMTEDHQE